MPIFPPPPILTAAEYTVGPGGSYANLEALRTATGVLQSGDTIILNGDDNSLTRRFGVASLTFKGSGVIRPAASNSNIMYSSGNITLDSNSLEFRNFQWNDDGGVFCGNNVVLSGGTNTFTNNSANGMGGAIASSTYLTLSGGTNTFTGNSARYGGGAIGSYHVVLSGGTNTFTNNSTNGLGGAIYTDEGQVVLMATNGDITFRGNRDRVGTANEKANAIHAEFAGYYNTVFNAGEGQSIYFYDPIVMGQNYVQINNRATDTGRVVFDGSDYTRDVDRYSQVLNTTVGYGELQLRGNVVYGAANDVGTFTLGQWATLLTDASTNKIQANTITVNGNVGINSGGVLELAAAQGVTFNGTMYVGLGLEDFTSGIISVLGNLTFGNKAALDLYWGDSVTPLDGWSQVYDMSDLFLATGKTSGWGNFDFNMSSFEETGFEWTWNGNVLTLSYLGDDPSTTPEPATLLVLGLGAIGAGFVARRRK